jgi:hypothetical protein
MMKFWRISSGEDGFLWSEQKDNGCIAISWDEFGDAKKWTRKHSVRPILKSDILQANLELDTVPAARILLLSESMQQIVFICGKK